MHPTGIKKCMTCKREMPVGNFHRQGGNKDGLRCYCKDCSRASNRRRLYGISNTLANACDICHKKHSLTVDHCHKTGNVRGTLCGSCNRAIGLFQDNKEFLTRAVKYLESFEPLK